MLSKTVLYYGRNEPFSEPIALKAGPLTMQFEPETGLLRYIRIGDHEIARAIYAAVRDHNWATIAPQLSNLQQRIEKDSFHLQFDVRCHQGEVDYFWKGTISGQRDGTLGYSFGGEARSSFQRNRIGICLLHPITECAGQPCTVEHSDGKAEQGLFPKFILATQPFLDVRKISYTLAGVTATFTFAGDEFEMEDQRNYSDASFKTYCTPQSRPKPVAVHVGDKVNQSVVLTLQQPVRSVLPVVLGRPPQLSISTTPVMTLPPIGFSMERTGRALGSCEIELLRALRPDHLRVDLQLSQPGYQLLLRSAGDQSAALNVPLHVAVILSDNAERELQQLTAELKSTKARVAMWLIFHEDEECVQEKWVKLAIEHLRAYEPNALFGAGTLAFFTELNLHRPAAQPTAFPCFSVNPQVHAFDNATMVENLAGQAMVVESAREFSAKPVVVSPITLKIRSTDPNTASLSPDVDSRQMSLFGAGWSLGSIARLATTGHVQALTYFETVGSRGIIAGEQGPKFGEQFSSVAGSVYPIYHLFADIAEFPGRQIHPTHSSHPLITEGLTLIDNKGRRRILVANFSGQAQEVKIKTGTCRATVRYLDETNAENAMSDPEGFRARKGEPSESVTGKIALRLLPFALARVDIDAG